VIIPGRHEIYQRRRDTITGFQSDHGGEFIDVELQQWAKDRVIAWFFSAPYVHQQNGKIERLMRVVGERTRAVLNDSKLPTFLWPEVMRSVVFTRNLLPYHGRHIKDGPKSPYEIRYGRKPDVSFLSIIGSDVYVVLQKEQIRRNPVGRHLASHTWKGKLVGYNSLYGSGYRVYRPYANRPKGTLHDVRDIIIDEGSDFSIYHNPDLPPIDTSTPTNVERATPAPITESTTAYEGQGVAQMDTTADEGQGVA
jgi:hypothetical protein